MALREYLLYTSNLAHRRKNIAAVQGQAVGVPGFYCLINK